MQIEDDISFEHRILSLQKDEPVSKEKGSSRRTKGSTSRATRIDVSSLEKFMECINRLTQEQTRLTQEQTHLRNYMLLLPEICAEVAHMLTFNSYA
jgi:hypothetical protein